MNFSNSTGIRRLPYRTIRELASLLDIPGSHDWRALVAVLPENFYTHAEVCEIISDSRSILSILDLRMSKSCRVTMRRWVRFQVLWSFWY